MGLGAEIAKNLVLMGVEFLSLYDPNPVLIQDLGTNVSYYSPCTNSPHCEIDLTVLLVLVLSS